MGLKYRLDSVVEVGRTWPEAAFGSRKKSSDAAA
jgi:hypothetical protein